MKDRVTIVGAAIYIVVNVKYTYVFLHLRIFTFTAERC